MEIMKLTIKEDFHRGICCLFSFSHKKITLFLKKYDIKSITLISMYQPFKTSCELAGSFKIKMQMYKLVFVLTLFRSFSYLFFKEKFYRRFVYFEDTVTYFDKIVMFFHRRKQSDILKFIHL